MRVCVNLWLSKIMPTSIKVGICMYVTYASYWTLMKSSRDQCDTLHKTFCTIKIVSYLTQLTGFYMMATLAFNEWNCCCWLCKYSHYKVYHKISVPKIKAKSWKRISPFTTVQITHWWCFYYMTQSYPLEGALLCG